MAAHFGLELLTGDINFSSDVELAADALLQSGENLVSEMMRQKASMDAGIAPQLYLKHLANEFGSPQFQQAWKQMEEALKAKIEGKSRMQLEISRAIPPSAKPLNALPPTSDSGSTSD